MIVESLPLKLSISQEYYLTKISDIRYLVVFESLNYIPVHLLKRHFR